jgi:hypothetical protein
MRHNLSDLGFEDPSLNYKRSISIANATSTPVRKWAYAFLVGGVLNPLAEYRGFLYGVVVAAKILRDAGSRADVVVMVQLSYNTNATRIPQEEEDLLASVGVKIKYLPKFAGKVHEQFYALVMEKFRVLEMTEYSRVLFLDSDIMPACNLDYMFELSEPPLVQGTQPSPPFFKENVVLSTKNEAAHAGFFMLAPGPGKYRELKEIIRRREEEALNMTFPYWDPEIGWGQRFNNVTDYWRSYNGRSGTMWDWWSCFADQGLIYYWAKYHQKSTSVIIGSEVESWGTDESGMLQLESTSTGGALDTFSCVPRSGVYRRMPSPYRDYRHFSGKSKPWDMEYTRLASGVASALESKATLLRQYLWFFTLQSVANATNLKISPSVFGKTESVGRFSDYKLMKKHIVAKKARGWTAYQ